MRQAQVLSLRTRSIHTTQPHQKKVSIMGMYDTFYLQDQGRTLAVQSKTFACVLGDYHLGDFVDFDLPAPMGITAHIEDHKQDWHDPDCPTEWVVLLLVDGCFIDSYVAPSQADAQQAAEVMVKLWASPERQADAFKRHAQRHYNRHDELNRAMNQVQRLLQDYADQQQPETEGRKALRFLQHDFEQESWDMALAQLLNRLPEFAEHLPDSYRVALELEGQNSPQEPDQ